MWRKREREKDGKRRRRRTIDWKCLSWRSPATSSSLSLAEGGKKREKMQYVFPRQVVGNTPSSADSWHNRPAPCSDAKAHHSWSIFKQPAMDYILSTAALRPSRRQLGVVSPTKTKCPNQKKRENVSRIWVIIVIQLSQRRKRDEKKMLQVKSLL